VSIRKGWNYTEDVDKLIARHTDVEDQIAELLEPYGFELDCDDETHPAVVTVKMRAALSPADRKKLDDLFQEYDEIERKIDNA
jgi:aspartate aminotransferase-like enzyme